MESFEITFFSRNKAFGSNQISIINNYAKSLQLLNKQIAIEHFVEERKNFSEIRISFFGIVMEKNSFHSIIAEMYELVSIIFQNFSFFEFATGVYELTYYYTENIISLNKFDSIFCKFPILFLKPEHKYFGGKILFENNYVKCIFQEDAQALY